MMKEHLESEGLKYLKTDMATEIGTGLRYQAHMVPWIKGEFVQPMQPPECVGCEDESMMFDEWWIYAGDEQDDAWCRACKPFVTDSEANQMKERDSISGYGLMVDTVAISVITLSACLLSLYLVDNRAFQFFSPLAIYIMATVGVLWSGRRCGNALGRALYGLFNRNS